MSLKSKVLAVSVTAVLIGGAVGAAAMPAAAVIPTPWCGVLCAGPAAGDPAPVSFTRPDPGTATATTRITHDPDGGNGTPSNWATDTITRTVTVTRGAKVPGTNCGLAATADCWAYSSSLRDTGRFVTIPGAGSPNQAPGAVPAPGHIRSAARGTLNGTYAVTFYASSADPKAAYVARAHDDGGLPASSPYTSTTWAEQFFAAGTHFGTFTGGAYNWTYRTTGLHPVQQWVDSSANGDGNQAGDGNIIG